ncbi:MAG: hypothetical protein WDZ49_12625 [Litorilinea sp.]
MNVEDAIQPIGVDDGVVDTIPLQRHIGPNVQIAGYIPVFGGPGKGQDILVGGDIYGIGVARIVIGALDGSAQAAISRRAVVTRIQRKIVYGRINLDGDLRLGGKRQTQAKYDCQAQRNE